MELVQSVESNKVILKPETIEKILNSIFKPFLGESHVQAYLKQLRTALAKRRYPVNVNPQEIVRLTEEQIRNSLKPRPLRPNEIEEILEQLPETRALTIQVRENIHLNLQSVLREQLAEVEITPIGIPDLIKDIREKFLKAEAVPGEAVGIRAAEAMGQQITQMTLNSFHTSGSAKNVSYGIESMRELLSVSKERAVKNMTIAFKDKDLTYDDVLRRQNEFVGLTVGNLIRDYDIESTEGFERPEWVDNYLKKKGKTLPESRHFLILRLDPILLKQYRVSLPKVVNIIEKGPPRTVAAWYAGDENPLVYIYPDEEDIQIETIKKRNKDLKDLTIGPENLSYAFLKVAILPYLQNDAFIQGVSGIERVFPKVLRVWDIVEDEQPSYSESYLKTLENVEERNRLKRRWKIFYNRRIQRQTGIPLDRLLHLLEVMKMRFIDNQELQKLGVGVEVEFPNIPPSELSVTRIRQEEIDNGYRVEFSDKSSEEQIKQSLDNFKKEGYDTSKKDDLVYELKWISPRSLFNRLYAAVGNEKQADFRMRLGLTREEEIPEPRELSEFEKAAEYLMAETNGSNMIDVFKLPGIDYRHTISNNIIEIYDVLGIEAVRNFLIKEFIDTLAHQDAYIDPRHVVLIVDFMTQRGELIPISPSGATKSGATTLKKATIERALESFVTAAATGSSQPLQGVSDSVSVGKRVQLGTGYVNLMIDPAYEEKLKEEAQKPQSSYKEEDVTKALDYLESQPQSLQVDDLDDELNNAPVIKKKVTINARVEIGPPPIGRKPLETIPLEDAIPPASSSYIRPDLVKPQQLLGVVPKLSEQTYVQDNPQVQVVTTRKVDVAPRIELKELEDIPDF